MFGIDLDYLESRAFAKTRYDYLFQYLFTFTNLRFKEIVLIRSVKSEFVSFENFCFVYIVRYIDDALNLNIIEVTLLPNIDDCYFQSFDLSEVDSYEIQ